MSKINVCPDCGSMEIFLYMGGGLGMMYSCNDCKYMGPVMLELEKEEKTK